MKNWKRWIAVMIVMIMTAAMAAGCTGSSDKKTSDGDKTLFSYDGTDVSLKEAWIYCKMLASQYQQSYSMYFGENFWTMSMYQDEDGKPMSIEEYVKRQAISQIKQIIVLDKKAAEYKLSLTEKEKKECEKYAKAFAKDETAGAVLKECGGSQEDIQKIYEDNLLAGKVRDKMIEKTDTNVSDDEARESRIFRIVYETTTTDDKGETKPMDDKGKAEVKAKAEAVWKQIVGGKSIEDAAKEQEYTNTDETFAAGQSEEGEAFEKQLAGMKDGDMFQGVQECENGYVIAKLVAYTDKEATENNRQSIIEERQQKTFSDTYTEWTKDLEKDWDYKTSVDQELWAQLVLHSEESTQAESSETVMSTEEDSATTEAAPAATEAPKGAEGQADGTTAASDAAATTAAADSQAATEAAK